MINYSELYKRDFQINPIPNPNRKYKTYWKQKNSSLYEDMIKPLGLDEQQIFSIGDEYYVLNIDFSIYQENIELVKSFIDKYKPVLIVGKYTNGNKHCMVSHLEELTMNEYRFVSNVLSCTNHGPLNNSFVGFLFLLDQ